MACRSDKGGDHSLPVRKAKKNMKPGENRVIHVENGLIHYLYLTGRKMAFCTYDALLLKILSDIGLSPFLAGRAHEKIRFHKHSAKAIKGNCFLSELCAALYYGKIQSYETWIQDLAFFRRWMRNFKLEIDHADGNQMNCTKYNLSIMSAENNNNKHDISTRIKQPVVCSSGYYDGEYRIFAYWPNVRRKSGAVGVYLNLRCRSAKDYKDSLFDIYNIGDGYGAPQYSTTEGGWRDGRRSVTKADTGVSIALQELMGKTPSECFHLGKAGQVEKLFRDAVDDI